MFSKNNFSSMYLEIHDYLKRTIGKHLFGKRTIDNSKWTNGQLENRHFENEEYSA